MMSINLNTEQGPGAGGLPCVITFLSRSELCLCEAQIPPQRIVREFHIGNNQEPSDCIIKNSLILRIASENRHAYPLLNARFNLPQFSRKVIGSELSPITLFARLEQSL